MSSNTPSLRVRVDRLRRGTVDNPCAAIENTRADYSQGRCFAPTYAPFFLHSPLAATDSGNGTYSAAIHLKSRKIFLQRRRQVLLLPLCPQSILELAHYTLAALRSSKHRTSFIQAFF